MAYVPLLKLHETDYLGKLMLRTCYGAMSGKQRIFFSLLTLKNSHIAYLKSSHCCGDDADRQEDLLGLD